MNNRITPYNITELKENEIFVFGSNSNGVHNGNAAATVMKFGAIMGQAVGIQGQTYALPNTLRILKNILMIFCYMRNNIRNIFF
mgnify:CR=1 FL=1